MQIRAGEILRSTDGQYYRVLEANERSISLMRVNGQTIPFLLAVLSMSLLPSLSQPPNPLRCALRFS